MTQNNAKIEKPLPIDWSVFKWALITLLLSILAGGILIISGQKYQQYWAEREPIEKKNFDKINQIYKKARTASDIVNNGDLDLYRELVKTGFFNPSKNVSTKEQHIVVTQKIKEFFTTLLAKKPFSVKPKLEFAGTDQVPYPVAQLESLGITQELKVYATPIQLEVELLHDGDVLKLLQETPMEERIGFVKLHYCKVERLRKTNVEDTTLQPYLKLKCLLMWYTAHLEKEGEKNELESKGKKKS